MKTERCRRNCFSVMGIDNRQLWRIINSRVQEVDFAGLAPKARRWAAEKAGGDEDDVRLPVRSFIGQAGLRTSKNRKNPAKRKPRDPRLPAPGVAIHKQYKGRNYLVTVLDKGFEYEGACYKSLSAVANEITGSHWNGFEFFGLKASPKETE